MGRLLTCGFVSCDPCHTSMQLLYYLYSTIPRRCPKILILKANNKAIKLFRGRCFLNCSSFHFYLKLMILLLLIILLQVIFLLGYGPDSPPRKLFLIKNLTKTGSDILLKQPAQPTSFSWTSVVLFFLWASIFASCVLFLCGLYLKEYGGLQEMLQRYIHMMQISNNLLFYINSVELSISFQHDMPSNNRNI